MANLKVTVLYEVWEEGPAEERKSLRRVSARGKKQTQEEGEDTDDREEIFEALDKARTRAVVPRSRRQEAILARARKVLAPTLSSTSPSPMRATTPRRRTLLPILDLLHIPYTGAGPQAHYPRPGQVDRQKDLRFHKIQTPDFATSYRGTHRSLARIAFPLIVKPISEDGSIGIDAAPSSPA